MSEIKQVPECASVQPAEAVPDPLRMQYQALLDQSYLPNSTVMRHDFPEGGNLRRVVEGAGQWFTAFYPSGEKAFPSAIMSSQNHQEDEYKRGSEDRTSASWTVERPEGGLNITAIFDQVTKTPKLETGRAYNSQNMLLSRFEYSLNPDQSITSCARSASPEDNGTSVFVWSMKP